MNPFFFHRVLVIFPDLEMGRRVNFETVPRPSPNFREEIFKDSPSSFRDSIYKYDLTTRTKLHRPPRMLRVSVRIIRCYFSSTWCLRHFFHLVLMIPPSIHQILHVDLRVFSSDFLLNSYRFIHLKIFNYRVSRINYKRRKKECNNYFTFEN